MIETAPSTLEHRPQFGRRASDPDWYSPATEREQRTSVDAITAELRQRILAVRRFGRVAIETRPTR